MSNSDQEQSTAQPTGDHNLDLKTLFVRSIPEDITDEQLTNFFSNFAPTRHAVVVKDVNKKSRGFGFVSFTSEEDAKQALEQGRKTQLDGHLLRIDIARRRERSGGVAGGSEGGPSGNRKYTSGNGDLMGGKPKLIVRNMPWSCRDPEKLKKIFSRYGTVVDASIPRKKDGKLCGFAFVTMKKLANCKLAIENSKDLKIDGRQVAVDFAVQKSKWEEYQREHGGNLMTSTGDKEGTEGSISGSDASSVDDDEPSSKEEDNGESESEIEVASSSEKEEEEEDSEEGGSEDEDVGDEDNDDDTLSRPKKNRRDRYSVFVRNVPYDATEESLFEHFSKFGPVRYALPVLDKETGLSKGTAFVAFRNEKAYNFCIQNSPKAGTTSLLIGDNVLPEYVYEGRVLSVTPTLDREEASRKAEKNAEMRKAILGKAPDARDKRNLYLLNEGRVQEGSKLASLLTPTDMDIREKSYRLRVEQLRTNPALHLSLTRLAIRNLPRAMTDKALKALARKAVVEFAKEVKLGKRHPLTQEEIVRSTKERYKFMTPEEIEREKKKDKKHGIVKQAKVIMEVKGSTVGRSRGYGFVEYKDHKHALMGLRWLNVHAVTHEELVSGLTPEELETISFDSKKSRRLVVEFAIENANVVKRRRDHMQQARRDAKRKREDEAEAPAEPQGGRSSKKSKKDKSGSSTQSKGGEMDDKTRRLIGLKRKRKHSKK